MLEATWNIPNSDDWPDITDPFITLSAAEINDIYIPSDGTALECVGPTGFNSGVSFVEIEPEDPGEIEMVLANGFGELLGPKIDGGITTGHGRLRSRETGCGPGKCSSARFQDWMDGTWDLNGLWLYGATSATVGNQAIKMEVDSYTIVLEGSVTGTSPEHGVYQIEAGRARFVVGATGAGSGASLRATNSSAISLRERGAGWHVLPFSLEYVDAGGMTWTLTISHTDWSFVR